ncbi:tetratricopeptide repeat protein [Lignipirellula cremea]|uniref:Tetratricopeptide repeat protein n=1 Tax=Lignipirellula cremea TaxID=2528010 RepID=A0A518DKL9_9BACT|nr:hypothetical protein [Lignipirellula cremea]QDU92379.1 hypothetical protein Pla8534_01250 [Lignipirellula cremea]
MLMKTVKKSEIFEHWKWIALSFIAGVVAVALTAPTAAGGDPTPQTLPEEMTECALPMPVMDQRETLASPEEEYQTCLDLWLALAQHEQGAYGEAVATWRTLALPQRTHVWRELAIGAALLEQHRYAESSKLLEVVTQEHPQNPVGFYLLGVAQTEHGLAPPRFDALQSFERAITLADTRHDDSLVPNNWGEIADPQGAYMPIAPPSVSHLLGSLGIDTLPVQAMFQAARLQLHRGEFEIAEERLDRATEAGIDTLIEYRTLEQKLEAEGRTLDAVRVRNKVMKLELNDMQRQAFVPQQFFVR